MVWCHTLVLAAILAGNHDLVLLDFGADWCEPCRTMEPTVERLEEAGYPVRRVNVDQNPDLARRFNIGPIPCFVLVKNGREIQRIVGATSYDRLVRMYEQGGAGHEAAGDETQHKQSSEGAQTPPQRPNRPRELCVADSAIEPRPSEGRDSQSQAPGPSARSERHSKETQQRVLQATVRLRVADETGYSRGTGTIIDSHNGEALVLTCGHIFRESGGKGDIQVDLFAPGSESSISGELLAYECQARDFGLLSIRPDVPVTPVQVATPDCHPREEQEVFSVGCDQGDDPSVRTSTISAIDRYMGPPNIEIHGSPVDGRSGGGLFTSDGRLIGICNAADLQEDRGIYAGLPTVHLALDQIGQRAVYLNQPSEPQVAAGGDQASPDPAAATDTNPPAASTTISPASHEPPADSLQPWEMICIVRSPNGSNEILTVNNPSRELLQRMADESQHQKPPTRQRTNASPSPSVARLSELPSAQQPIIRGQDQ
ncbi:MAG: trypsin-like peptidase domain-containing protein [Planctomycetota bacterium]